MSETKQPQWKLIANLGDVDPVTYGGFFVFVDETGVYDAEAEYWPEREEGEKQIVYRFILEPCTFVDGVLSDNKFHPNYATWFAKDIPAIAEFAGGSYDEMIADFISA